MKRKNDDSKIIAELSKLSKEALINAFIKNNLFGAESLLINAKHEEVEILIKKQQDISSELKKLDGFKDYKKYKELSSKYQRYAKQLDKLLDLYE